MGWGPSVFPASFPSFLPLSLPGRPSPPPILAHLLSLNEVVFTERHFLMPLKRHSHPRITPAIDLITHLASHSILIVSLPGEQKR